jgi:hypothetical protein
MPTKTKTEPLPVTRAAAESDAAQSAAEALRIKAAEAQAEALEAQRLANAVALVLTEQELDRRRVLNETTVRLAPAAIAKANQDAEDALVRFRDHVTEQPWLADLVAFLAAKLTARTWITERNGAHMQLVGPDEASPGTEVWEPEPIVSIETLVASIVSSAAHDVRAVLQSAITAHRDAFVAGQIDDPTPPTSNQE